MSYTPLPIGIDDFKEIIENKYYYVDKTWLIKELIEKKGKVNLFTRPRRFGKTLNLSMLKYYFEIPVNGESNKQLFYGLKIAQTEGEYLSEQEAYPVIMLTLKSAKQPSWDLAFTMLKRAICGEFERHKFILRDANLSDKAKRYRRIMTEAGQMPDYIDALQFLSGCLYEYYQKKVIIFIDEYDVPLENAYYAGFYNEMITFIRSLFESALKTNPYLAFSAITGCLRISKESIFTGLNHMKIISILNEDYGEHFGFVEKEVHEMLSFYNRENKMDTMREWYDGYLFGSAEVYNPWSVINYVERLCTKEDAFPLAAWSNTSSNSIIKDMIYHATEAVKDEIENLISGNTIEKKVHEDITYGDIWDSEDHLWNFLLFTGYLKVISTRMESEDWYVTMAIPNAEVRSIYRNQISNWFRDEVKMQDLSVLYTAMLDGDADMFQQELGKQLQKTISYMDSGESFYHGFLLGILANLGTYRIKSNREAGNGRYDICVYHADETISPVILELKISDTFKGMEAQAQKALQQIEQRRYEKGLAEEGYTQCICYGIAFYKKKCRIVMKRMKVEE